MEHECVDNTNGEAVNIDLGNVNALFAEIDELSRLQSQLCETQEELIEERSTTTTFPSESSVNNYSVHSSTFDIRGVDKNQEQKVELEFITVSTEESTTNTPLEGSQHTPDLQNREIKSYPATYMPAGWPSGVIRRLSGSFSTAFQSFIADKFKDNEDDLRLSNVEIRQISGTHTGVEVSVIDNCLSFDDSWVDFELCSINVDEAKTAAIANENENNPQSMQSCGTEKNCTLSSDESHSLSSILSHEFQTAKAEYSAENALDASSSATCKEPTELVYSDETLEDNAEDETDSRNLVYEKHILSTEVESSKPSIVPEDYDEQGNDDECLETNIFEVNYLACAEPANVEASAVESSQNRVEKSANLEQHRETGCAENVGDLNLLTSSEIEYPFQEETLNIESSEVDRCVATVVSNDFEVLNEPTPSCEIVTDDQEYEKNTFHYRQASLADYTMSWNQMNQMGLGSCSSIETTAGISLSMDEGMFHAETNGLLLAASMHSKVANARKLEQSLNLQELQRREQIFALCDNLIGRIQDRGPSRNVVDICSGWQAMDSQVSPVSPKTATGALANNTGAFPSDSDPESDQQQKKLGLDLHSSCSSTAADRRSGASVGVAGERGAGMGVDALEASVREAKLKLQQLKTNLDEIRERQTTTVSELEDKRAKVQTQLRNEVLSLDTKRDALEQIVRRKRILSRAASNTHKMEERKVELQREKIERLKEEHEVTNKHLDVSVESQKEELLLKYSLEAQQLEAELRLFEDMEFHLLEKQMLLATEQPDVDGYSHLIAQLEVQERELLGVIQNREMSMDMLQQDVLRRDRELGEVKATFGKETDRLTNEMHKQRQHLLDLQLQYAQLLQMEDSKHRQQVASLQLTNTQITPLSGPVATSVNPQLQESSSSAVNHHHSLTSGYFLASKPAPILSQDSGLAASTPACLNVMTRSQDLSSQHHTATRISNPMHPQTLSLTNNMKELNVHYGLTSPSRPVYPTSMLTPSRATNFSPDSVDRTERWAPRTPQFHSKHRIQPPSTHQSSNGFHVRDLSLSFQRTTSPLGEEAGTFPSPSMRSTPLSKSKVNSGNELNSNAAAKSQARPLTCYLPNSEKDLDMREHLEALGHWLPGCPDMAVDQMSCRGFLLKRSHYLGNRRLASWKRRWFVFDRMKKTLVYYGDNSETKLKGGVPFSAIEEVYCDHLNQLKSPNPHLTFIVKTKVKPFSLVAPTAACMRIWIDVIVTGCEGNTLYK